MVFGLGIFPKMAGQHPGHLLQLPPRRSPQVPLWKSLCGRNIFGRIAWYSHRKDNKNISNFPTLAGNYCGIFSVQVKNSAPPAKTAGNWWQVALFGGFKRPWSRQRGGNSAVFAGFFHYHFSQAANNQSLGGLREGKTPVFSFCNPPPP